MPLPLAGFSGNFCLKSGALQRPVRRAQLKAPRTSNPIPQPYSRPDNATRRRTGAVLRQSCSSCGHSGKFRGFCRAAGPVAIELACLANPPVSKVGPLDAPLAQGLLISMLIPSTTIPLYRLTMHQRPSSVRAISECSRSLPEEFAGDHSRMTFCPKGPHDFELQIRGFGDPPGGVPVLRRHPRLCYGHSLQLGLHCERCDLKRQLKPPAQSNGQQRRRTGRKSPPAFLPHIPKNKSAPRAVACEADSGLLTALEKTRKNKNQLLSLVSILIP